MRPKSSYHRLYRQIKYSSKMEINLSAVTVFLIISYVVLFVTSFLLVYSKNIFGDPKPSLGKWGWITSLKWLILMALLVAAPVFFLNEMNNQFIKINDSFAKIDKASHKIRDAFNKDEGSKCSNFTGATAETVGSVVVGALFDAEYGYLIDIIGYMDVVVNAFWGVGMLVLAGPHLIAFLIWCKPKFYNAIFVMPIFLSFQIVFPGLTSMGLSMLYYKYALDISSVETSITDTLGKVDSVVGTNSNCSIPVACTDDKCKHAKALVSFLEFSFNIKAEPAEECLQYLEKEACEVKDGIDIVKDNGDSLGLDVILYNYLTLAFVAVFIIASSQLLLARKAKKGSQGAKLSEIELSLI